MIKPEQVNHVKLDDDIQERVANYAHNLSYDRLPAEVVQGAKMRIMDTLGALIAGFDGEPCSIARELAHGKPNAQGATILGTNIKTNVDLAAFVNATTARYPELTDSYHAPGTAHGHASDVIAPVLSAAEYAGASGRDLIVGVVLAYEVFLRISDQFRSAGYDNVNFACLGSAMGAGKVLGLSAEQLGHCLAMAAVPNNILKQVKRGDATTFRVAASGQAGRAGVFSAMLAKAGLQGPNRPFRGQAGWCAHIVNKPFALAVMGGDGAPYKILETQIKMRSASGEAIPCIFAAEKIAPLKNVEDVSHVKVEVCGYAKEHAGNQADRWNPDSRAAADHSIPFVVAAALLHGTVTLRSFDDESRRDPQLRALIQKIEVVENPEFTLAFDRAPVEHHCRVTVTTAGGEHLTGHSGGDEDDMSTPKSAAQIESKFRDLTQPSFGLERANTLIEQLRHLENLANTATLPPGFVIG